MSEYVIKEEQFLRILDKVFKTLYKDVKYKNDKSRLSVYSGKNLRRYKVINNYGNWDPPTYIMDYYPHDESLWISDFVYTKLKDYFPPKFDNLLFFDFFKKWFIDKFGITPKKTYINNQKTLNNRYNS